MISRTIPYKRMNTQHWKTRQMENQTSISDQVITHMMSCIKTSQNLILGEVGREPWRTCDPAVWFKQRHSEPAAQNCIRQLLQTSNHKAAQPLWAPCVSAQSLSQQENFPDAQTELPLFQSVLLVLSLETASIQSCLCPPFSYLQILTRFPLSLLL